MPYFLTNLGALTRASGPDDPGSLAGVVPAADDSDGAADDAAVELAAVPVEKVKKLFRRYSSPKEWIKAIAKMKKKTKQAKKPHTEVRNHFLPSPAVPDTR